jgi:hypothetical protein
VSAAAPSVKALADAKVKRQKQILAVGSVILLALLGFELPKMLGGHGSANATTQAAPAAPATPSPAALAPGQLPDTDQAVLTTQSDQLLSFGLFKSKDPFIPQLSAEPVPVGIPAPASAAPPATAPPPSAGSRPQRGAPAPSAPGPTTTTIPGVSPIGPAPTPGSAPPAPATTPGGTAPTTTTPAPPPAPTSVAIATNGACEVVSVNGTFPNGAGIFRLLSIAKDGTSAKIAVVGGAFDSGQPAATLRLGEKLTLVNTADGTRYVLMLKSRCETTASAPATSPTATTTTPPTTTTTGTSTVPPPAPVPTPTTPIVTDPLDANTPTG